MSMTKNVPLAERLRPKSLTDFVGQTDIVGKGKIISRIIDGKVPSSLILWGPPGSGKTTLARLIAEQTGSDLMELSAVNASKSDVLRAIDEAKKPRINPAPFILFVDEIHRFNKAQQDSFLPYVENGTIILIGATTENPSFEVINPLLSRARVVVLKPLTEENIIRILQRGMRELKLAKTKLADSEIKLLARLSGGDARVALNNLELSYNLAAGKKLSQEIIETAAQKRLPAYDKKGDNHYDLISAFIKSLRGSQPDASLYYLARMLSAGEDPKFIARRMVIFASEDIGVAAPAALNLAVSAFLAVERIGLPEAQYALFECALVLSKSNKSRLVATAMNNALNAAGQYQNLSVPLELRNAPTKLMKNLGYNKGYKWEANYQVDAGFLPPEIRDIKIVPDEE